MDDDELDSALIAAAFQQAALSGWRELSLVEAAREAQLPLDRVRARFPTPAAVLMRFGLLADRAALVDTPAEPLVRDRLFDLLMRRFDVLQQHRGGMLALLRTLPSQPLLALALSAATGRSMGWMMEAAGESAQGITGRLRVVGLVGVWLQALRAWTTDESADLTGTMAALDKALDQAERLSSYLGGSHPAPEAVDPVAPSTEEAIAGLLTTEPPSKLEEPDARFPPPPPPANPPASPV